MAHRKHNAKPGDLIEFPRVIYNHWAVYIGNDEVVHLTTDDGSSPCCLSGSSSPCFLSSSSSPSPVSGSSSPSFLSGSSSPCCLSGISSFGGQAVVKRENIWRVAGPGGFKVNNVLDHKYKPKNPRVIVKEACEKVGQMPQFSVTAANCEHFVTELRYGKAESRQVRKAVRCVGVAAGATVAAAVAGPVGAAAVVILSYFF